MWRTGTHKRNVNTLSSRHSVTARRTETPALKTKKVENRKRTRERECVYVCMEGGGGGDDDEKESTKQKKKHKRSPSPMGSQQCDRESNALPRRMRFSVCFYLLFFCSFRSCCCAFFFAVAQIHSHWVVGRAKRKKGRGEVRRQTTWELASMRVSNGEYLHTLLCLFRGGGER